MAIINKTEIPPNCNNNNNNNNNKLPSRTPEFSRPLRKKTGFGSVKNTNHHVLTNRQTTQLHTCTASFSPREKKHPGFAASRTPSMHDATKTIPSRTQAGFSRPLRKYRFSERHEHRACIISLWPHYELRCELHCGLAVGEL